MMLFGDVGISKCKPINVSDPSSLAYLTFVVQSLN